jgi:hypothetical protein
MAGPLKHAHLLVYLLWSHGDFFLTLPVSGIYSIGWELELKGFGRK